MRGSWAAAFLLLAALPLKAETLRVVLPDGVCLMRSLPRGGVATEAAALREDADALAALSARLLADAARMRLAPAREGVPGFGDWAYGWVQSYVTSYRSLARGIASVVRSVASAEEAATMAARVAEEMAEPVRAEFRRRVLAPTLDDGGFAADLDHVGGVLDAAWRQALSTSAARLARQPVAAPGATAGSVLNLAAAGSPMGSALASAVPADPVEALTRQGADEGSVFVRSMRPMAARFAAVAIRLSEAGSLVVAGGAFGLAAGGVPGSVIGVAGGIGASWGLDWMLNRLDATFTRAGFEAQALEALAQAEQRLATEAADAAAVLLAARVAALATPGECP